MRLVKGDGEIIERIVSKEKQDELRRTATNYTPQSYTGKEKFPSQHPVFGYK